MSDERIWPSVLVAMILVGGIGSAFIYSDIHEPYVPGPSMPSHGYLTYEVNGSGENLNFNGSFTTVFEMTPGAVVSWSNGSDGDLGPESSDLSVGFWGSDGNYLDTVVLNTTWGEKVVHRSLGPACPGLRSGLYIFYIGAETALHYRIDLVMPDYRATYLLVDTNMTDISHMDLQEVEDTDHLTDFRTFIDGHGGNFTGAAVIWKLIEPEEGHDYQITFSSQNYTLLVMTEDDIVGMLDGSLFRYDPELSTIGGNDPTVLLEGDLFFMYARYDGQFGESARDGASFSYTVEVLEE